MKRTELTARDGERASVRSPMAAAAKEPRSASGEGTSNIKGVLKHGGRYVQYNVYGNLFELSAKYVPPIRPIGRGAYGFVW